MFRDRAVWDSASCDLSCARPVRLRVWSLATLVSRALWYFSERCAEGCCGSRGIRVLLLLFNSCWFCCWVLPVAVAGAAVSLAGARGAVAGAVKRHGRSGGYTITCSQCKKGKCARDCDADKGMPCTRFRALNLTCCVRDCSCSRCSSGSTRGWWQSSSEVLRWLGASVRRQR